MIGFLPNESELQNPGPVGGGTGSSPGEKEVPPVKPGIEITTPNPSTVPSPKPDTIENSPSPEIKPIPMETPTPSTTPEIIPIQPVELSLKM